MTSKFPIPCFFQRQAERYIGSVGGSSSRQSIRDLEGKVGGRGVRDQLSQILGAVPEFGHVYYVATEVGVEAGIALTKQVVTYVL